MVEPWASIVGAIDASECNFHVVFLDTATGREKRAPWLGTENAPDVGGAWLTNRPLGDDRKRNYGPIAVDRVREREGGKHHKNLDLGTS